MKCDTYANAKTINERNKKKSSKANKPENFIHKPFNRNETYRMTSAPAPSNPFNLHSNDPSEHFNNNPFNNPFDEFK
jgi:hypothetical protein